MRRKSPQQKKRQSYLKDTRNVYGENSKSSRKNMRLKKRATARTNRHRVNSELTAVAGALDTEEADAVDSRVAAQPKGTWAKYRDAPLGDYVVNRLSRRIRTGIDAPAGAMARISKVRAATKRGNRSKAKRKLLGDVD
jgi:hypothetical protein